MNTSPTLLVRWLRFNGAGLLGVGVQLATLQLLVRGLGMHYLVATGLSVEAAVLHNFLWHERLTWRDRASFAPKGLAGRLLRFHAGNGLISIAGNLLLMRWLVGGTGIPVLLANVAAIGICSTLNFLVCHHFVFRAGQASNP